MPELIPVEHDPFADDTGHYRATILPARVNQATGETEWAWPGAIADPVRAWLRSQSALRAGQQPSIGDAAEVSLGMVPGGLAARDATLAAGFTRRPPPLDMSEAARMARAQAMGFLTDMPVYHGTSAPEFNAFDLSKGGSTTGAAPARTAIFLATDPETAAEFAQMPSEAGTGDPRTLNLLHRPGRATSLTLQGDEMNHEIAATLDDAFSRGYDAVMLKNYTTPSGSTGKNIIAIKDPSQLRRLGAAFDPARRDSADLLAGMAAGPQLVPVDHDPFDASNP